MKKRICVLFGFCLLGLSCFSQFQSLETLDEVMIGPSNVDIHYVEQVNYYLDKYNRMAEYLRELDANHQAELKNQESKKKSKIWRKNRIKKEIELIGKIQADLEIVEDFIFLWENSKIGIARAQFEKEYDDQNCYEVSSFDRAYFSHEIKIEEEDRDFLEWVEFIPNQQIKEVEVNKLVKQGGHKWVKKRADKNCLSKDPNDCMVWCLVEIPAEFQTERYYDGITPDFKLSEDKQFLVRTYEVESSENRQYKLVNTIDNSEIEIKDFKKVSCN